MKEHNVIIVLPNMRLNLRDKMHMRIYRMELERAADELEIMNLRMGGAKEMKAKKGYYSSGAIAVGYLIYKTISASTRDKSIGETRTRVKGVDKFLVYEPHAYIIKRIFSELPECNFSAILVSRKLQKEGVIVPPWPPELKHMEPCSTTLRLKWIPGKGCSTTPRLVMRVITNPVYIGWWIWAVL